MIYYRLELYNSCLVHLSLLNTLLTIITISLDLVLSKEEIHFRLELMAHLSVHPYHFEEPSCKWPFHLFKGSGRPGPRYISLLIEKGWAHVSWEYPISSNFCTLGCLHFNDPKTSDTKTLTWATDFLNRYGPSLGEDDQSILTPPRTIFPGLILSEHDTMTHGRHSFLQHALIAVIFLHVQHNGLSALEAGCHSFGNWELQDHSTTGSEWWTDLLIVKLNVVRNTNRDPVAVVCKAKTYHTCCSKDRVVGGGY
jgi:hypothetical protein